MKKAFTLAGMNFGFAPGQQGDKQNGRSIQLLWSSARKNRSISDVEVCLLWAVSTAAVLFSPLAGVFVRAAAVVDHAFVPDVGVVAVVWPRPEPVADRRHFFVAVFSAPGLVVARPSDAPDPVSDGDLRPAFGALRRVGD